jgi:hypothetical protein
MESILLLFHQAVVLLVATVITKACRDNGKSYWATFGIGIVASLVFASVAALQAVQGYRCIQQSDPLYGGCDEYEEVKRNPSDACMGPLVGTVPMGLLSLFLRKRWEEKNK